MRSSSFCLSLLTACVLAACSPSLSPIEAEEFVGRQGPIVHGTTELTELHEAVVALSVGRGMCTGTLISSNVVLTAAHCVENVRIERIHVGFGREMFGGSTHWIPASEVKIHPDWDSEETAWDVALIKFRGAAPEGIRPVPHLPAEIGLSSKDVGSTVEFAGFGQDERGDSGILMRVSDQISALCLSDSHCAYGGQIGAMGPRTFCYDQKPGGPCSGDSGGPAFIERDGVTYVAGITSYGDEMCSFFGCSMIVSEFQDFIDSFLLDSNGNACTSNSECASGVCSEGVCCDKACGEDGCTTCVAEGSVGTCSPIADGTLCDDQDLCTLQQSCMAGVCTPSEFVGCPMANECRPAISCEPTTGQCAGPAAPDGTACGDEGSCVSGECVVAVVESCGSCSGLGLELSALWTLGLLLLRRRR